MKRKGFTLVELIVVLAIIAILGAIAVPVITGMMKKGDEQNDEVNASLYTSVMQQFASKKAGEALLYPGLTTTGEDSEYSLLHDKSGQGLFPGYNILEYDNDDEIYAAIRREAVIAIKAFSNVKTLDGYYVAQPTKEHYQYVYYYLTGEVRIEDERTKTPIRKTDIASGVINTEDFWVYLSRDGGSGEAIGNSENGTGMVFVQIRQFGTDQLLEGTTVTLNIGSEQRTAVTGVSGTVGFSNVDLGSIYISAEKLGAVSFPDSRFYDQTGEIRVKNGGYIGDSAANPYVITLKMGSLGSIGFYKRTNTWNGTAWNVTDAYITQDVVFTSKFSVDTSKDYGFAREETYTTNAQSTGGRQELLTPEGKFLLYGPYVLRVTASNFRTYTEQVVSKVYGIDNYDNGGTGKYASATEPYEYPIIMKRPEGTGQVSGVIRWERAQQPLVGTPSYTGTWLDGYKDYAVRTRAVMKNKSTGSLYYSAYFTAESSGYYPYTISNLPDGKYEIYLDTPYGNSSKLSLSEFPSEVTIDGTEVKIDAQVYYSDVGTGSVSATVTYDSNGNNDPIPGTTVEFTRLGSVAYSAVTTSDNGTCSLSSVKCGFYQVKVTVPNYIGTNTFTYKIFVSGDEDIIIRLPIQTITVSGTISGLKSDGTTAMDKSGSFGGLTITFTRYNSTGTKKYSSVTATVTTTGLTAPYSVKLVPGMYKITTSVTCYQSYSGAGTLRNYKANTSFNFSLMINGSNITCHPNAKIEWKQNSTHHWQECSKCGTVFNKSAHTYSAWTAQGATGCYRYCTEVNCKRTLNSVTAHDYQYTSAGSWASTCVTNGNKHYNCSRCGYGKDELVAKSGHNYGAWTSDGAATHSRTCRNSGCTSKETKDHVFGGWYWTSTTPVMCSNGRCCYYNGTQRRDCTTCGYYETNSPMVGHSIECYMMRHYVNDDLYYNFPTSYSMAFFRTANWRVYSRLADSSDYTGRRVFAPGSPSAGSYGMSYKVTTLSSSFFTQSSIFSNTKHSHLIACGNRPTINGVQYYCHASINHNGNPLGTYCGCNNKPLGYVVTSGGAEIKPSLNPAWESPYAKYGR